ncbi:MAG TPA: helix-turn-helix domain-containing protein [Bacteroidales bacterium]|jgi:hypothetical protein|nr:helix-turn-helix domain-containing protein [Bacteroidales bacterium]
MESQEKQIRQYLSEGNRLTPLDALRLFGCFRLSARIYDLKKSGFSVQVRKIQTLDGKTVAQYFH